MNAYDDAVLADGPVAFWKLDETALPFADSAGSHNIATLSGAGTFTISPTPYYQTTAINLGTSYISTGYSFTAAPGVTYECFANVLDNTKTVIGSSRSSGSSTTPGIDFMTGSGAAGNGWTTGDLVGAWGEYNVGIGRYWSTPIIDNVWHHYAVTWQGAAGGVAATQFALYVDSVRVDDTSNTYHSDASTTLTSAQLIIGASTALPSGYIPPILSRFAVYDKALSAAQILAHYQKAQYFLPGAWGWVG